MKLVVGCPVGPDRAWALPTWFRCLRQQTRQPDEFVFVVRDNDDDSIRRLLHEHAQVRPPALSYAIDRYPHFIPRYERNFHEHEIVYGEFARRRNQLLDMVCRREPDVFLSLDSDVMLDEPTVIEQLLAPIEQGVADLAAPALFLHPGGHASEIYNAAWWAAGDPGSPDRAWRRATHEDAARGVQQIDIPMAAVAMSRQVLDLCEYRYHAQGEDLGFAQDIDRHRLVCWWMPELLVRHVMSPEAL